MTIEWTAAKAAQAILDFMELSVDDETGEISDEDLAESIELDLEFGSIVGAAGSAYRQLQAQAAAYKEEGEHYYELSNRKKKESDRLRQRIKEQMEKLDTKRVTSPFGGATIQQSTPKLEITGPVPEAYLVPQDPRVDKAAIMKAMKAAERTSIDFAQIKQGTHLRFR